MIKIFLFKVLWVNFVPSCFLRIDGITSYFYAKFQYIWRTDMNRKYFEKFYIETVISI